MVAFLGCRSGLVILMFILTHTFGGLADSGTSVAIVDIAPRYAGKNQNYKKFGSNCKQ